MLLGTMYIPYRKAYISGMNPLSFVTVFTIGELGTILTLGSIFYGGPTHLVSVLDSARPMLFWPFLGGFCWVIGDLFQNYAAKYFGIGRGIPLSNTNQLWGLAWGALVFGEFTALTFSGKLLIIAGSSIMIAGAIAISLAAPPRLELENWRAAMNRECLRYDLDSEQVAALVAGDDPAADHPRNRRWWEILIASATFAIFVWLAAGTRTQHMAVSIPWMTVLIVGTLIPLGITGMLLWRRTRFS